MVRKNSSQNIKKKEEEEKEDGDRVGKGLKEETEGDGRGRWGRKKRRG